MIYYNCKPGDVVRDKGGNLFLMVDGNLLETEEDDSLMSAVLIQQVVEQLLVLKQPVEFVKRVNLEELRQKILHLIEKEIHE